jgi:hypothetical protein
MLSGKWHWSKVFLVSLGICTIVACLVCLGLAPSVDSSLAWKIVWVILCCLVTVAALAGFILARRENPQVLRMGRLLARVLVIFGWIGVAGLVYFCLIWFYQLPTWRSK